MNATSHRLIGAIGLVTAVLAGPPATPAAAAEVKVAPCNTFRLGIAAGQPEGAAGSSYLPIYFINTSRATCVLSGYPKVIYVAPDGSQVNDPAHPEGTGKPPTLRLRPSSAAVAVLRMPNAGNFPPDQCRPVPVDQIWVSPPGDNHPAGLMMPGTACSVSGVGTAGVTALRWAASNPSSYSL